MGEIQQHPRPVVARNLISMAAKRRPNHQLKQGEDSMVLKKKWRSRTKNLTNTGVKQLEKKVKKTKRRVSQLRLDSLLNQRDESDKLQDKIFELQQQIDAKETKGPVFQVCDPSLHRLHLYRSAGVDVYFEDYRSIERKLVTRIPINVDYLKVWEDMTMNERSEMLEPLVQGLKIAYDKSDQPMVHLQVVMNDTHWTQEE